MLTKYPNSKQFKRELDSDKLEQRYLFLGEEEGEKDKCVNRIIVMAFSDQTERAQSTGRFHIENDEFMNAADFALSPSMFYSRRICVMYNIESLTYNKNKAVFDDLFANLPDSTILIMTSREIKPPSFLTSAMLNVVKTVQFWRYFENDMHNYVTMSVKRLARTIDDAALELLIERTGNDIKKIDDAIEMIRFSGEAGMVTVDMIKNFIDDVKDASVFDFIDSLFKRETKALGLLKKIYEDGTPDLRILYQIIRQAEIIERYYSLSDAGIAPDEAMKQAGVYSKNKENFWGYTKSFPREMLKKIFPLVSAADYKIKSSVSKELASNPVFNLVTELVCQK